jgi:WD40 repeat protein
MSRFSQFLFFTLGAAFLMGVLGIAAVDVGAQQDKKVKKDAKKDKDKVVDKDKAPEKDKDAVKDKDKGPEKDKVADKDKKDKKDDKDKKEEKKVEFKADTPAQEFKYVADKDKTHWVQAVAFGPGGKTVAATYRDRTIKIWDLAAKKESQTLKGPAKDAKGLAEYRSIVFAGDQVFVGTGWWDDKKKARQGEIRSWDSKSGKQGKGLTGHAQDVEGLAISKDGKSLASASEDNTALIWNLAEGKTTQTIKGHTDFVTSVSFNPEGTQVVTTSKDKTLRVWDVAGAKEIANFKVEREVEIKDAKGKVTKQKELGREFTHAVFSSDGKKVIAGNLDGAIKFYDVEGKKEERELKAHEGVWALALSPDGTKLATGGWDGTIKIWNVADGKDLKTIKAHPNPSDPFRGGTVTSVSFSSDGQWLASGSIDGTVRIWSVK